MDNLTADFIISNENPIEAEYEISESDNFDCSFEIFASGTVWGNIAGNIENQTDLIDFVDVKLSALGSKVDIDIAALEDEIDTKINNLNSTVTSNYNELSSEISDLSATVNDNYTDLEGRITTTNSNLADLSATVLNNKTQTDSAISSLSQTVVNNYNSLDNKIDSTESDLDTRITTNSDNIASIQNAINDFGDIVSYDASSFATSIQGQKADTAIQPNDDITRLNNNAGYITSADLPTVNNSTITIQKNGVTQGDFNLNQANNETINFTVPTTASDIGALADTTAIEDLTTPAQQSALNSGATANNIAQIATNTNNLSSLSTTVSDNYITLDNKINSVEQTLNGSISNEATARANADSNLQSQIDAITSASDVTDIVGTYAQLQAYDTSSLANNSIIKVLSDESRNDKTTYYRWVITNGVGAWVLIGEEGPYYTKSVADNTFVPQTRTINGKSLSSNINLTASDVGAMPSGATIGSGILTIQNNGVDVDTFSANANSNKTINITSATKTSDLTNDSGFLTSSDLSGYATTSDLTTGLSTKQDTINDLSTIRTNSTNGQSAYTAIQGYGNVVTHDTSEFATSAQGDLADTALQQGDDISLLNNNAGFISGITSSDVTTALGYTPYNSTNPAGYTTNAGTVTSVNNVSPDSNGNVTIQTGGTVDQTFDGTSANAQSGVAINGAGFLNYSQDLYNWTQPTEVVIGSSAIGGDSFAAYCIYDTELEYAFDDDLETAWYFDPTDLITHDSGVADLIIYNPNPLLLSNVNINYSSATVSNITSVRVYGSYDNSTWVSLKSSTPVSTNQDITISTTFKFKYFKISFECTDPVEVTEIKLTAQEQITTTNLTSAIIRNCLGYTPENTTRKVTSLSSSSTNTQYPSAKCMYDELQDKQDTSTAVTHTASTAVGSSTTPVYIASDGTATACSRSLLAVTYNSSTQTLTIA